MSYTGMMKSSDLIEAVRRRAFLPEVQNSLDKSDILKFINEELFDSVVPLILSMHEDFFTNTAVIPLESNKQAYKIPYRAIGRQVRDVKYKDTNNDVFPMTRIDPVQRNFYQNMYNPRFRAFFLRSDEIVLAEVVGDNPVGALEFLYYLRPNILVEEERVSTITNIDRTTGIVTVDNVPSNITVSSKLDFLEYNPGHTILGIDVTPTNIVANTITFSTSVIPEDLNIGDVIALSGECIIPQIPTELHSMLAERAAARCLNSLGDATALATSNSKIAEMEKNASNLIGTRTDGQPKKIVNRYSLLNTSRVARRRRIF